MLNNSLGFTYIRSLVAFSIAVSIILTMMPTITLITVERQKLIDQKVISTALQNHLQTTVVDNSSPLEKRFSEVINNRNVNFSFHQTGHLLEGCALWKDVKANQAKFCLYYYKK